MYRICLLCAMGVLVYGNSDETKYIDLLPEAEKQEFLNRIARRIIEEIQGKERPEQSHAEISDDQLNAHHTYVQDLINEESQNLRNERRNFNNTDNIDKNDENEDVERANMSDEHNNPGITENSQHIDLTLRKDRHSEEDTRKTDESAYSVIPVSVIYDKEDVETTEPPKSNSSIAYESVNTNKEESHSTESLHFNDSTSDSITNLQQDFNQSNLNSTHSISQVLEDESENASNNDIEVFTTANKQILRYNSEGSSTENPVNTDAAVTSVEEDATVTSVDEESNSHDDSLNNTESSTKVYTSLNNNTQNIDISPTVTDGEISNTHTAIPLTTEIYEESQTKHSKNDESTSAIIHITTLKRTKGHLNKKTDIDGVSMAHTKKTDEVKPNKSIKNKIPKNYLRSRLDVIPKEYGIDGPQKKYNKAKRIKSKKPYLVYEVPDEKPIFIQKAKYSEQQEEPYVIPIYDYAPKNAYYNAYNRFGVNNDGESKIVDKELNLRTGFVIDLSPQAVYRKDINVPNEYLMKHSHRPHWAHILNSKLQYNPNAYQDNEHLRRKIKEDEDKTEKLYELSKIPVKIKYIPLRQQSESNYDDVRMGINKRLHGTPNIPNANEREKIGVLKTYSYQQEKFSYQNPSTYERVVGENYGLKFSNGKRKGDVKTTPKDIELDYYFGKYKVNNRTGGIDYSVEYLDVNDQQEISAEHPKIYDFTNDKREDSVAKHYRMDVDDDCEFGCIEMDVVTGDRSDKYLQALVKVLKDMIYRDRADLVNYNWLRSTVDLESALKKLIALTETIEKGNKIHPLDMKLLKYIYTIYNTSSSKLENTIQPRKQSQALRDINYIVNSFLKLLRRRIALPKNKNKKPGHKLANPIQFWYRYYIRDGADDMRTTNREDLRSFKKFLNELEDNLLEFHNAIKQIALITTYGNQNWYEDLKNIYFKSASNKQLLRVVLHLAASRLFSSIEETAKDAEEDKQYVNKNPEGVRRIQEEFVLVLKVLQRIKKLKQ